MSLPTARCFFLAQIRTHCWPAIPGAVGRINDRLLSFFEHSLALWMQRPTNHVTQLVDLFPHVVMRNQPRSRVRLRERCREDSDACAAVKIVTLGQTHFCARLLIELIPIPPILLGRDAISLTHALTGISSQIRMCLMQSASSFCSTHVAGKS